MTLKILLLQQYYFPEMAGGARRAMELSEQFVKNKHTVTVLTSFPREFRSMPGFGAKEYEILNKVTVIRKNTIFNVGRNVIFRMLSYFMYVVNSFIYIVQNKKKYDILISMAPLPSAIAPALANKIYKIPHHFDVPDILPDLGISAGMISNRWMIYWLYKLEKWVYNNSDTISTITQGQFDNINNKGISKKKLICISGWIDDQYFSHNLKLFKDEISKLINYPNKKIISFIGNIGALQNPEIFLDIMSLFYSEGNNEVVFLFIGDGIMLPYLKKITLSKKLDNVKFIGRLHKKYIPAVMERSDILVANYVTDEHLELYIPLKLIEYANSDTPIIIGARGDSKNFIEKYQLGIATSPSDIIGFKESIIKVLGDEYNHEPKTSRFREDYSIDNVIKNYNLIFKKNLKK